MEVTAVVLPLRMMPGGSGPESGAVAQVKSSSPPETVIVAAYGTLTLAGNSCTVFITGLPSDTSVTEAAAAELTTEVAVMIASTAPLTLAGALKVTVVAVMSLRVPVPGLVLQVQIQVTPALFTSAVTLADTTIVVPTWIWVTLPGVLSTTPVLTPTLPVTPRLVALLQAASARTRLSGHNSLEATAPAHHGDPRRITLNEFSSNPGNPVGRGATGLRARAAPSFGPPSIATLERRISSKRAAALCPKPPLQLPQPEQRQRREPAGLKAAGAAGFAERRADGGSGRVGTANVIGDRQRDADGAERGDDQIGDVLIGVDQLIAGGGIRCPLVADDRITAGSRAGAAIEPDLLTRRAGGARRRDLHEHAGGRLHRGRRVEHAHAAGCGGADAFRRSTRFGEVAIAIRGQGSELAFGAGGRRGGREHQCA